MTDPKPPDNLSGEDVSANNALTAGGAPVDEEIGTFIAPIGVKKSRIYWAF